MTEEPGAMEGLGRRMTDERLAVIESDEPTFQINAVAGSGKTTTLAEYAARRRNKRIP